MKNINFKLRLNPHLLLAGFITLITFGSTCSLAMVLDAAKGHTAFLAIGRPAAIKINGKGSGPTGALKFKKTPTNWILSGDVQVDLDSFDTGIGMRDHHMKEKYLETGKFKTANLKLTDVAVPTDIEQKGGEVATTAVLSLHGVEKPVAVVVKLDRQPDGFKAEAKFKIKLSDFTIMIPTFTGITVADDVEVTSDMNLPLTWSEGSM